MNYKSPDNSLHFIEPEFAHLLPEGSVPITEDEAEALRPKPEPPTPLEQIRALETQYADDQAKITRQTLLLTVVEGALASPAGVAMTAGMDPEIAKATIVAILLVTDKSFKLMYELEQNISILRAQIP